MSFWTAEMMHHRIEALGISFGLSSNHGGWIFREKFKDKLQPVLRTTGSLKHLSLGFDEILHEERSVCYAILSRDTSKYSELDLHIGSWGSSASEYMIGLCFLYFPHATDRNTAQIGVALLPKARGKGYGRAAVHKLLTYAFEQLKMHRVFVHIVCPTTAAQSPKERKQTSFDTKKLCYIFRTYGFQFEGVTRGAVLHQVGNTKTWQDIHRLSILDTDWISMQMGTLSTIASSLWVGAPPNPFDEMKQRHETEQREMAGWCENPSSSLAADDDDDETYYCSDGSSDGYEDSDD
ncbi:hypothetical protein FS749_014731 [Ceratobasidium sp. UAMH 11750]|nr:hypothetical protein FS749_014731 [Ceratobasidium sp. UAMH 11750]